MPLFDLKNAFSGMGKFYLVRVKCRNCNHIGEIRVPKGVTVSEHVTSGQGKCNNCGCSQLNASSTPMPVAKPKRGRNPAPAYNPLPQEGGQGTW